MSEALLAPQHKRIVDPVRELDLGQQNRLWVRDAYLDVVVDNFKESAGMDGDAMNNFPESGICKSLRDPAGINSTHRIIRPILCISFDGALHGYSPVEDNIYQR